MIKYQKKGENYDYTYTNASNFVNYNNYINVCVEFIQEYHNNRYDRKGSLFIKNFKRNLIESTEQWQETFLYIHLNPVKHKFVTQIEEWKWSSWHAYKNLKLNSLLNRSEALSYFDNLDNLLYCSEEKRHKILNMNME